MVTEPNTESLTDTTEAIGVVQGGAHAGSDNTYGVGAGDNGHQAKLTIPADASGRAAQPGHLFFEPQIIKGDARHLDGIEDRSVDLVVTSPPYWRKRDYGVENQIGQENTAEAYVASVITALKEWRRVLRPTGSVFLNIGDTYYKRSLAGIPGMIEAAAVKDRWLIRNRIIWAKRRGMPEPAKNRLASRYEFIFHFTVGTDYYYDLFAYAERFGNGANPGDIWHIDPARHMGDHLAPFPSEIVERAILLACPERVCVRCGKPETREVRRTMELDPNRPQAKRAMEIARQAGLTEEHIAAVQATGVSDAGKALKVQTGTGKNSARVKELAAQAKKVLGGYFREFTFARRVHDGWKKHCACDADTTPGVLLDPFMGTGTSLKIAAKMGRSAIGVDLSPGS